jgi:hypothetical protein
MSMRKLAGWVSKDIPASHDANGAYLDLLFGAPEDLPIDPRWGGGAIWRFLANFNWRTESWPLRLPDAYLQSYADLTVDCP